MRILLKIATFILSKQPKRLIKDEDLEYLLWISNLYLKIINTPGHIAEIGVANGRNAILFGRLIKLHNETGGLANKGESDYAHFKYSHLLPISH